jgi:hypothetical protein
MINNSPLYAAAVIVLWLLRNGSYTKPEIMNLKNSAQPT